MSYDKNLVLQDENQYYPFGLLQKRPTDVMVASNYKYNGKELQDELSLNKYTYGWRDYDASLGRWQNIDALSKKYYTTSPYTFVNNNPILNIEIDGRWFDEKNERRAQRYEKKLDKKINQLNKQIEKFQKDGKSTGDLADRVTELSKSKSDIMDMRNATQASGGNEYRFEKATSKNGHSDGTNSTVSKDGVVTMYVNKDTALGIHEIRHGGQDARKEYSMTTGQNYGVSDEQSAYKAQYSYSGIFSYNSHNFDQSLSNVINRALLNNGIVPPTARVNITNISGITPAMVNDIGNYYKNNNGSAVIPLYPPDNITPTNFNNN